MFLGDNMTKYHKEHVERLVAAMNDFVITLGHGLEKNEELIKSDQLVLQNELKRGYAYLQTELARYMTLVSGAEEEPLVEESAEDADD